MLCFVVFVFCLLVFFVVDVVVALFLDISSLQATRTLAEISFARVLVPSFVMLCFKL